MKLWQILLLAFVASIALSVYGWKGRPSWPLQLLAAALCLAISYPLIFGGLGFITIAIALCQIALAVVLYRQRRTL